MKMIQKSWSRLNDQLFLMVIDSAHSGLPAVRKSPEFRIVSNFAVPNQ
jgi:hypothetical protein